MKLSEELKIKRAEKVARMTAILEARKENGTLRAATTEETTEYNGLKAEVTGLDTDITEAEGLEARGIEQPQQRSVNIGGKASKQYNIGKAVTEFARSKTASTLTGLEAEQHQELARTISSDGLLVPYTDVVSQRASDTTTNADSLDKTIYPGLSIIGKEPLWQSMGLTVLPGLTGILSLGKKTPDIAGEYAEKADITATSNKATFVDLAPSRFGATDLFPRELLAQENPAVHAAYLNDLLAGCDRKITARIYAIALAAATEVAAGALTMAGFNALMGAIDIDGAFAMDRGSFFAAKGIAIDSGSGKFLTSLTGKNGVGLTHDGASVFYSTLFDDGAAKQYVQYGAWSEIWMGLWGAVEILINPYTYQQSSQTQITVNKLANMVCRNDAAFVKSPDLDSAT